MNELFAGENASIIFFALSLLGTGIIAGLLAGLLGVGGGIVIVPVLFIMLPLLGVDVTIAMHIAVGTSLATIILTSIMSMRAHHQRGAVDWQLLKSWGIAIVVGVVAGSVIAGWAKGTVLTAVFATVALLVSIHMTLRMEGMVLADHLPPGPIRFSIGMLIGALSTLMGIGGGTFSVPVLSACNYPIRRAVGTASAIGLIIALPGAIGFAVGGWGVQNLPAGSLGYVNIIALMFIIPGTMLAAPWGAKIAHAIQPQKLRMAFAAFLFLTSMRMFYSLF